jgi:hypothetical protein
MWSEMGRVLVAPPSPLTMRTYWCGSSHLYASRMALCHIEATVHASSQRRESASTS